MKIVRPSVELINPPEYKTLLSTIEQAGRVCYKSENKIKEGSAEHDYMQLIKIGMPPEAARAVLPNSLKTEVVMTANIREWRHFFRLRCARAAHPDMRTVASMLALTMAVNYPVFFEDVEA